MTGNTHIIGGVTVAAACMAFQQPFPDLGGSTARDIILKGLWTASCVLGSILPDIDLPTSKIGHRFGFISVLANKFCGHRGFFHSLLFLALLLIPFYVWAPAYAWVGIGIVLGGVSHLLLDMLNLRGIALFWPIKKKISIASIELHSMEELVVDIVLGLGLAYSLFSMSR